MNLSFSWLKDPNNPRSLSARFRARRWAKFCATFPDLHELDILDVGGRAGQWIGRTPQPRSITITNLPHEPIPQGLPTNIRVLSWNTFEPPPPEMLDRSYSLVHSNSVIEHVGDTTARAAFADVLRAIAPNLWVQTPNRFFPIEPHWLFPFFQFLPRGGKVLVDRYWPLSHGGATAKTGAATRVDSTELIDARELSRLFPDANLQRERFLGLTKSLIASRQRSQAG